MTQKETIRRAYSLILDEIIKAGRMTPETREIRAILGAAVDSMRKAEHARRKALYHAAGLV